MNLRQNAALASIIATAGLPISHAFIAKTPPRQELALARTTSLAMSSPAIATKPKSYADLLSLEDVNVNVDVDAVDLDAAALMEKVKALEAEAKAWEAEADALEAQAAKMMLEEQVLVESSAEEQVVVEASASPELERDEEVKAATMSLREMLDRINAPSASAETTEEVVPVAVEEHIEEIVVAMEEETEEATITMEEEVAEVVAMEEKTELVTSTASLEDGIQNRAARRMSLRERLEQMNAPQEEKVEEVVVAAAATEEEIAPFSSSSSSPEEISQTSTTANNPVRKMNLRELVQMNAPVERRSRF